MQVQIVILKLLLKLVSTFVSTQWAHVICYAFNPRMLSLYTSTHTYTLVYVKRTLD